MNAFYEPFLSWLYLSTVQASILILVIFLLKAVIKHRLTANWYHLLWTLLLVRMVFPWGIGGGFGVVSLIPTETQQEVIELTRRDMSLFQLLTPATGPTPQAPSVNHEVAQLPVQTLTGVETDRSPTHWLGLVTSIVPPDLRLIGVLFLIWLLGCLFFTGLFVYHNLRFVSRISQGTEMTDQRLLSLLKTCQKEIGIRKSIRVVVTRHSMAPAVFGLLRPKMVFPEQLIRELGHDELRHVFLHELAHVKRYDILIGWLMIAMQLCHWFNPLLWLAARSMRLDREFAADGLALSILKTTKPNQYGKTILNLAEHFAHAGRLTPRVGFAGLIGVLEAQSAIKRRIKMIVRFNHHSYKWSPVAALVLITIGCVTLPDAKLDTKETSETEAAEDQRGLPGDSSDNHAGGWTPAVQAEAAAILDEAGGRELYADPRYQTDLEAGFAAKDRFYAKVIQQLAGRPDSDPVKHSIYFQFVLSYLKYAEVGESIEDSAMYLRKALKLLHQMRDTTDDQPNRGIYHLAIFEALRNLHRVAPNDTAATVEKLEEAMAALRAVTPSFSAGHPERPFVFERIAYSQALLADIVQDPNRKLNYLNGARELLTEALEDISPEMQQKMPLSTASLKFGLAALAARIGCFEQTANEKIVADEFNRKMVDIDRLIDDSAPPTNPAESDQWGRVLFQFGEKTKGLAQTITLQKTRAELKDKARAYYRAVIEKSPQSKYALNAAMLLGHYYLDDAQDHPKAIAAFEKVIQRGPAANVSYPEALYQLGKCHQAIQGNEAKAAEQFKATIQFAEQRTRHTQAKKFAELARREL
ncbi:MAG: M56 family metallopeptidase [Myxococcota bacterium]|nr:M56 family metallopeptidase [Myxococcota bacterium]